MSYIPKVIGKSMININKSPEELLQEELLREKAEVLGCAGDKVSEAINSLLKSEKKIEKHLLHLSSLSRKTDINDILKYSLQKKLVGKINQEIEKYNQMREHAELRYYYLIVIREAMGLRRHHRLDEFYKVPPKKRYVKDV
jgi:hypothetical protein